MQKAGWGRGLLMGAAACMLLLGGALVSLTAFLNGQGLRERIETALAGALGRPVHIGTLQFSLANASAVAHGVWIGDDMRFGASPFMQADDVRLGLALWPLLSRREVQIRSVELHRPQIRLIRDQSGSWNYASMGVHGRPPSPAATNDNAKRLEPATLSVSRLAIDDGQVLVRVASAGVDAQDRVYDGVELAIMQFGIDRAFPFRVAARLPAGGAVQVSGSAGPWNRQVPAETAITAHVVATHLDLAATGLTRTGSRVVGLLEAVTTDLRWGSQGLRVDRLAVQSPTLRVRAAERDEGSDFTSRSVWSSLLERLEVESASVQVGSLVFDRHDGSAVALHAADVAVGRWAPNQAAPFSMHSTLGGGSLVVKGSFVSTQHVQGSAALSLNAQLRLKHVDLTQGLVPRGSPVRGSADADLTVIGSEQGWSAEGTATFDRLVLARGGQPAPGPVTANIRVQQLPQAEGFSRGLIQRADLSFDGAVLHVGGTYGSKGPVTLLDLQVRGEAMPIDSIEAYLPAAGLQLPLGSRLAGGTLSLDLAVQGTPADLQLNGPVRIEATRLNGYDLGGKLASLARFTGGRLGSSGNSGTSIRSLAFQLHTAGRQIATDGLIADIAGVGRVSGSGTVGDGATLHYNLLLRLEELTAGAGGGANLARGIASGLPPALAAKALRVINALASGPMRNGIPLLIEGTAAHPLVTPNLGALMPEGRPAPQPSRSPWTQPQNTWPGVPR